MRQRSLAPSPRWRKVMFAGSVDSQYLVGSSSPSGHSISSHSFAGLAGRSWRDATQTRTRANREDSHSFVPSRHLTARHAFVGSARATSLAEIAWGTSRRPFFGTRPSRRLGAHSNAGDSIP